jgi:chromosome partitioning protein
MKRAVFNQKGGVGKTSITCNLAAACAKAKRKTLVIDLDSQANSTQYLLGANAPGITKTIADFFADTLSFKLFKNTLREATYRTPFDNLWIVPAERSLSELQPKLEGRYKIFKLREAVDELMDELGFEHVFFDTPPALNFYSMSALMAADRVLVPFDCDAFSAEALLQVQDVVNEVAADHQPDLKIEGVIINHFMAQAKLPQAAIDALVARGFNVLSPYLSSSIGMRESHAANAPIVFLKPKHKLAQEFSALAAKLLQPATAGAKTKASRQAATRDL